MKKLALLTAEARSSEWPDGHLRVEPLEDRGWRPAPFQQFVLKLHSRCNLACDYCYVYQMADQTWRSRPLRMDPGTISRAAERIAEHVRAYGLGKVRVILHGGEPLLAGADLIADTASVLRRTIPAGTAVELTVQTNGVLLDKAFLEMLLENDVRVGVSLDGDRRAHDRHRRYADGRGSHDGVSRALRLLGQARYRRLFGGLLCTIDLDHDPVRTYVALLDFAPPVVDFLLPHGNWTVRPPRLDGDPGSTPYADWLIRVFDRWYGAPRQETDVRLFQNVIQLLLGGRSGTELIGLAPSTVITVETDGSLEQIDTLKSAYHGAARTGLNVFEHSFDTALSHPSIVARQIGVAALSETCRQCPVRDVCGGGFYPHRYRADSGFRNPSVYCGDLRRLIGHIAGRLHSDLAGLLEPPA